MKKLIILLILILAIPVIAQDNTSLAIVNGSVIKMIHDWEGSVGYFPPMPMADGEGKIHYQTDIIGYDDLCGTITWSRIEMRPDGKIDYVPVPQDTTDKGEYVTVPIEEAKTEWAIRDTHKLLLQSFHQRYQEDYIELIKLIKDDMMLIHKDMPAEAKLNEQLQAFVIPKPKEEKKDEKKD